MGTGYFPGVECGRGVTLTHHPLLGPRSKNRVDYTYTLPKGFRGLWRGWNLHKWDIPAAVTGAFYLVIKMIKTVPPFCCVPAARHFRKVEVWWSCSTCCYDEGESPCKCCWCFPCTVIVKDIWLTVIYVNGILLDYAVEEWYENQRWIDWYIFVNFSCANATTCPLWTSWSPLPVVAEVTDFWGWDAHEAQLRWRNEVDGDIWIWSFRRGLIRKFY
jgi:hypothetical protein